MSSLKEVDSAVSLSEGASLKKVEPLGEGAAAHEAVVKTNGDVCGEGKAEDSKRTDASSKSNENEAMGASEEHEGRGESSRDGEAASEHDTGSSESKGKKKGEATTKVADETGEVNQEEQDTHQDDKSDSDSSSSSGPESQPSIPPLSEAIFAAAESLYDAYVDLGFHLAEVSDENTRNVLEAAMESVMKAAKKMKVVEKAGEEMMREIEGEQEQPAKWLGHPPAATRCSKSSNQQKEQQGRRDPSSSQDLDSVKEPQQEPQSTSNPLLPQPSLVAERATDSCKVPAAATAASERSQSRDSQWSPQKQRKVAKVELSGSYPVKKWDARNNSKDPGPKLYCVSSGDRGPAARGPGASPPKELYDQASMLFNFAKYRSLLNASEEGKRVAFMMGLAHQPNQPRATMLRCITADNFKGKLEAREEGRNWSTQELREHRL